MGVIRFLGQHKGAVALVMLLLLLKAGCELAVPVLTSQIVDVGIAQSGVEDLDVLAGYKAAGVDLFPIQMAYLLRIGGLMLLAAAGSMVLDVAAGFVSARTGAKIGRDLRRRLFARVVAFSDAEINRFSAASLITRGTNDVTLIQNHEKPTVTQYLLFFFYYQKHSIIPGQKSKKSLFCPWNMKKILLYLHYLIQIIYKHFTKDHSSAPACLCAFSLSARSRSAWDTRRYSGVCSIAVSVRPSL